VFPSAMFAAIVSKTCLREFENEKMISEDDLKRGETELQKITDDFIKEINELGERKEVEVMEV